MRFELPDRARLLDTESAYTLRNYAGNNPVAYLKRRRFQTALSIAARRPSAGAIDMGCCDGVLIPSLAKYYQHVLAVDVHIEDAVHAGLLSAAG